MRKQILVIFNIKMAFLTASEIKITKPMMTKGSILFYSLLISFSIFGQDRQAYIEKFKDIAIREMERTGVPASIKLAQGILESGAGGSYLARKANNHFGIKCHSNWTGKKVYREDDDYDEFGRLQKSCFRGYKNAEESYIAHSEFLRDPRKEHRYGFLFRLEVTDYKRWARGLKKSGYATSATYDKKLISVIESYDLTRFDKMTTNNIDDTRFDEDLEPIAGLNLRMINDAKVVLASQGDTPQKIAERAQVSFKCVKKWNDHIEEPDQVLKEETRVFIQPKRKNFRGKRKWHYVQEGETMYSISQLYGVKPKHLYKRNLLPKNSEPEVNERIKLRGWKISIKDRPRFRNQMDFGDLENPVEVKKEDEFMDESDPITPEMPEIEVVPEIKVEDKPEPIEEEITPPIDETTITPPVIIPPPNNSDNGDNDDKPSPTSSEYYTVIKGDTLYSISRRFGTTVDALKSLNGLSSNIIAVGLRLQIK